MLTYFWDESSDMHVDPNAPFPPYTNTLPAAITSSSRLSRPVNTNK